MCVCREERCVTTQKRLCSRLASYYGAIGCFAYSQRDTSRHLEWLKTVKESHGSVAMTSLTQAKAINSCGMYLVGGVVSDEGLITQSNSCLRLENVVRLTVPFTDEHENVQNKIYSLDELKDLQSKLMLIAGKAEKGKDDVETFVKVGMKISAGNFHFHFILPLCTVALCNNRLTL